MLNPFDRLYKGPGPTEPVKKKKTTTQTKGSTRPAAKNVFSCIPNKAPDPRAVQISINSTIRSTKSTNGDLKSRQALELALREEILALKEENLALRERNLSQRESQAQTQVYSTGYDSLDVYRLPPPLPVEAYPVNEISDHWELSQHPKT